MRGWIWSVPLACLVGCGSTAGGATAGGATSGPSTSDPSDSDAADSSPSTSGGDDEVDGVRLVVRSVRELGLLGEVYAGPDNRYVVAEMTISNESRDMPVPTAFALFSVRTEGGLEFAASPSTALLEDPCTGDAQVVEGGSYDCSVAFELGHDEEPSAVVFRPDVDVELIVEIESAQCTPCGNDCVDLATNADHCGECSSAVGPMQTCHDGAPACDPDLTACGSECVSIVDDPQHCGACDQPIPDGFGCVGGAPECVGGDTLCDDSCVDLSSDPLNCGACGDAVPGGQTCAGGEPVCPGGEAQCGGSCVDLSTDDAHCGECDAVCPPSYQGMLNGVHGNPCLDNPCGCNQGSCRAWLAVYERVTCDSVCGEWNLDCTLADWIYSSSNIQGGEATCDGVPPAVHPDISFHDFVATSCRCES